MVRIGLLLIAVVALLWSDLDPALAAKRVALVIGNGAYKHVPALPNPRNDAKDVAQKLQTLGFDVKILNDASYNDLREALAELSSSAVGAEVGAVFYAGHGIEVDHQNYLIPVDAKLETDVRVRFEAMPLDDVMAALEGVTGVRLVMLDACRNNPFISSMKIKTANRAISRGLSRVEPNVGSLVSFSAKEGTTAADGSGGHSPYTTALLANLDKPGIEINRLFRIVRDEVLAATDGEQEPYTYGSTSSVEIFLKDPVKEPPVSPVPAQPPVPVADQIMADFQLAKDVGTKEAWEAFLDRHGKVKDNFYVNLAVAALQKLQPSMPTKAEDKSPATTEPTTTASVNQEQLAPEVDKLPASKLEKQSTPPKKITQPATKAKSKPRKPTTATASTAPEATSPPKKKTSAPTAKEKSAQGKGKGSSYCRGFPNAWGCGGGVLGKAPTPRYQ